MVVLDGWAFFLGWKSDTPDVVSYDFLRRRLVVVLVWIVVGRLWLVEILAGFKTTPRDRNSWMLGSWGDGMIMGENPGRIEWIEFDSLKERVFVSLVIFCFDGFSNQE
ncbi:MAG: hypothetical protein JWM04_1234 [Verrucomicrobiales bacterium]|nr:hypothetical protein [Verrucomicrobiales bacterium]